MSSISLTGSVPLTIARKAVSLDIYDDQFLLRMQIYYAKIHLINLIGNVEPLGNYDYYCLFVLVLAICFE